MGWRSHCLRERYRPTGRGGRLLLVRCDSRWRRRGDARFEWKTSSLRGWPRPCPCFGYCRAPNAPAKKTSGSVDGRDVQVVDAPDDDPVVAGGVLGDDLALEGGEGVGEQRYAAVARAAQSRPANRSAPARGRASCEVLVLPSQHVDAEAPRPPHARPGERAARRAERDQGRLERDGRERVDDQPGGLAVRRRGDEGDAGREPAERVAERARVGRRRGGGWSCERHLSAATAASPSATWAR